MDKRYTKATIVEKADDKIVAVASTASEDRHGESISVAGWELKNFKKAPRILWAHDHYTPAIGKATKVWIEGEGKKAKLMFEMVFQEVTDLGKAAKQLVLDGFIDTFSVGFRPLEMDGNMYVSQELLEISLVNVPANADARRLAYKSLNESGFDNKVMEHAGIPADVMEMLDAQDVKIAEVKSMAEAAVKGLKHLNPQGRKKEVTAQRLTGLKVVIRGVDTMISAEKQSAQPDSRRLLNLKTVKRGVEKLISDHKADLYG